ncbi:MAG: hypothetical protein D6798_04335, partial [Deltaproteobacteria bacterium]
MSPGRWRERAGLLLGLALLSIAAWRGFAVLEEAASWSPESAADALPLYLTTQVVASGGDPTDPGALAAAYRQHGVQTHALLFSTLYPASLPSLLQPIADRPWPAFLQAVRRLSLWTWFLGLAFAGAGSAGPRRRVLGAGVGAVVAMFGQPL